LGLALILGGVFLMGSVLITPTYLHAIFGQR
jgi:hypothetical protein